MRFNEEIRRTDELTLPAAEKAGSREVSIALALIDQLTEHFDPKNYKDTYTEELKKIVHAKAKGKPIKAGKPAKYHKATEVADIMSMLKKSLQKEKSRA
ncbi:MAG TPA: hypothetical protein VF974_04650 [Patescibacteria group bacterium]